MTSRVHKARHRRIRRSARRWRGRSIARSSSQASLFGYGAPGNTQLPRSYGQFSLDLSDDPKLGYHYDPARARRILDAAGWSVGPGGMRREGRRARRVRARLRRQHVEREARRHADPRPGRATSASRSTCASTPPTSWSTSSSTRPAGKLRPDFDTQLWSIGGDPTPEFLLSLFTKAQIGVWNDSGFVNPQLRSALQAELQRADEPARAKRHPQAAAHRHDAAALHRALRGRRHQRRQHAHVDELDDPAVAGRPADHLVRLRHDHRAAPGRLATPSYPGVAVGARRARPCSPRCAARLIAYRREQAAARAASRSRSREAPA